MLSSLKCHKATENNLYSYKRTYLLCYTISTKSKNQVLFFISIFIHYYSNNFMVFIKENNQKEEHNNQRYNHKKDNGQ